MTKRENLQRVLVVAPHHDDEVLGVGGTIAKFAAKGDEVHVAVVTSGRPPLFDTELVRQVRSEAERANALLGVEAVRFLDFEAARLDTIPQGEINAALGQVVRDLRPDTVFIPFNGDLHVDHSLVFKSSLVALRPSPEYSPRAIYAYETLSETNWAGSYLTPDFVPNTFVNIGEHFGVKLAAMRCYESQIKPFPNERSIEALEALGRLRGSTVGVSAAEAFVLVRQLIS